ncbi:uncharacterized protein [Anabrus simplex]|uniref:uncharacterized protein isoform X2 n=1 Tax=Anabrus simplex TaxID=316456 RepID=UPI0035A2A17E
MKTSQPMLPLVFLLLLATCCSTVSAAHEGLPSSSSLERLWEEIGSVKTMMAGISDELGRFNTLYLGKLEHRMVSIATALSSVDSNVKNLQERAHVWDTFQLHVAAWNDQIKTLDKKVDILSRGHEKMELMDGKLNSLLNLDYKIERIVNKIIESDNKLANLGKSMENHREGSPLFGDVATRGVVSTLRIIERKLDRLHLGFNQFNNHINSHSRIPSGGRGSHWKPGIRREDILTPEGDESTSSIHSAGRGKLIIRCNAPVVIEELLRDVASKVDVMFDKMVAGQDKEGAEHLEDHHGGQHTNELRELSENKLLDRLWKRMTSPYKKTARALEALEATIRSAVNASSALWDDQVAMSDQLLSCCMDTSKHVREFTTENKERLLKIEKAVIDDASTCDSKMEEHFRQLHAACSSNATVKGEGTRRVQFETTRWNGPPPDDGVFGPGTRRGSGTVDEEIWTSSGIDSSGARGGGVAGDHDREGSGDEDQDGNSSETVEPPFIPVVSSAHSCEELLDTRHAHESRVYRLGPSELNAAGRDFYKRFCDMHTAGGGWTVIQRRGQFPGSQQNFTLSWNNYKHGFGDLDKEFWFGNDFIHRLTTQKDMILRIELESFDGKMAWAEYSNFRVASGDNLYRLTVGGYSGNASDSFSAHNGVYFSTVDRNNDDAPSCCPCAQSYGGGWWFYSCFEANLNGVFFRDGQPREDFRGLIWQYWLGDSSLKSTQMKIRPRELHVASPSGRTDPGFEEHSSTEDVDPLDIPEDP